MEEDETEQKQQCISCGRWFNECEIIGEVCVDCHVTVIEDEDEVRSRGTTNSRWNKHRIFRVYSVPGGIEAGLRTSKGVCISRLAWPTC